MNQNCHDCESPWVASTDMFGRNRCVRCTINWANHLESVADSVDGKAWCQYGGLAGPKELIVTEDTDMLVLSRKSGEAIQIGDDITVRVVYLGGDRVRIGIDAPSSTRILRTELARRDIDREATASD